MNADQNLLSRLELLEQELRTERQTRSRERQTRTRIAKALVAVVAVGSLVAGVQEARAWGACAGLLEPYGLKTFCAGNPALASDINGNFQALAKDLEAKVGTVTDANVTVKSNLAVTGTTTLTGKLTANGGAAVTGVLTADGVKSGYIAPAATTWQADGGKAVDGAVILNDNNGYKALMIVGRNGADGQRKVQLYDDVAVNHNLSVDGQYQSGGEPLFIVCKKTTGLSTAANTTQVFTAADCGGKLPSAQYVGALTGYAGCNNGALYNLLVVNEDGTNHPGVSQYGSTLCATTGNVSAIYFKVK